MAKLNCASIVIFAILLLSHNFQCSNAKRVLSSNRKTSSGRTPSSSNSGHVTKSYPTQSGSNGGASNSHADLAKLSYSGYNSAPNRPAAAPGGSSATGNSQPIGWNVPKSQGPPPAYSASNTAGGAHTNIHEPAPGYKPNNAAPPSYGSATGIHTPITATNTHGVQSSYPGATYQGAGGSYYPSAGQLPAGATYHAPGALPAGASYYPSAGHMPSGGYYSGGGHMPAGGGYHPGGGHYAGGGVPAGATYVQPGAALPPGAVFYSSPPQQSSSGLGFGSGLAAGAIGGALLGHALTPTQTRVVESAPAAGAGHSGTGDDRIIIINNGPPGSVTTTNAAGATVITTGGVAGENGTQPAAAPGVAAPADPAVPNVPLAPMGDNSATPAPGAAPPAGVQPPPPGAPAGEQPPPAGGIICVPMRINETDPADNTKMIEVEKIACYPAPPPPPTAGAEMNGTPPATVGEGGAPLAPLSPVTAASQQLQASSTQIPTIATSAAGALYSSLFAMLMPLLIAFVGMR